MRDERSLPDAQRHSARRVVRAVEVQQALAHVDALRPCVGLQRELVTGGEPVQRVRGVGLVSLQLERVGAGAGACVCLSQACV
jgi:hypothetical protein